MRESIPPPVPTEKPDNKPILTDGKSLYPTLPSQWQTTKGIEGPLSQAMGTTGKTCLECRLSFLPFTLEVLLKYKEMINSTAKDHSSRTSIHQNQESHRINTMSYLRAPYPPKTIIVALLASREAN